MVITVNSYLLFMLYQWMSHLKIIAAIAMCPVCTGRYKVWDEFRAEGLGGPVRRGLALEPAIVYLFLSPLSVTQSLAT